MMIDAHLKNITICVTTKTKGIVLPGMPLAMISLWI